MAHNLYHDTMVYSLAHGQGTPWHKLGVPSPGDFTAAEAIRMVPDLDNKLCKIRLYHEVHPAPDAVALNGEGFVEFSAPGTDDPTPTFQAIDGVCATMNLATMEILGECVSDGYGVLQNSEAMEVFDALFEDPEVKLHTLFALGKGERFCATVKVNGDFEVLNGDKLGGYMVLTTTHDGTGTLQVLFTDIRVVCENTLRASMQGGKDFINLKHTRNIKDRARLAGAILKDYKEHRTLVHAKFDEMARFIIDDQWINEYETLLFGDPSEAPEGAARTRITNKVSKFEALLYGGRGAAIPGVLGSAWGAYNAATEYGTHEFPLRGDTERAASVLFGSSGAFMQRAFDAAMELVHV